DVAAQLDRARRHLDHALAARDAAVRADQAAELRAHLVLGEPCPVCKQTVVTPPAAPPATALSQARATVTAAEQQGERVPEEQDERVGEEQAAAARLEQEAASARESTDAQIARLRQQLTGRPQTLAAVEEELAALDRLDTQARSADEQLRACRRARGEAAQA